jgi:hypothetical protein
MDAKKRMIRHDTPPDAELTRKDPSASRRVRRFGMHALGRGGFSLLHKKGINLDIGKQIHVKCPLLFSRQFCEGGGEWHEMKRGDFPGNSED